MDKSFISANVASPPEGKIVEGWHSNEIIKCVKQDGSWENEDGETILVEGWRLIEAKAADEPAETPAPPRARKPPLPTRTLQPPPAPRRMKALRKKK